MPCRSPLFGMASPDFDRRVTITAVPTSDSFLDGMGVVRPALCRRWGRAGIGDRQGIAQLPIQRHTRRGNDDGQHDRYQSAAYLPSRRCRRCVCAPGLIEQTALEFTPRLLVQSIVQHPILPVLLEFGKLLPIDRQLF